MRTADICERKHGGNANSTLANRHIEGRKESLRDRIYRFLVEQGPQTCEQISLRMGIRYTTVSARLAELKRDRWVTPSGAERETTGGATASVMRALGAAERNALLNPTRPGYSGRQGKLFG